MTTVAMECCAKIADSEDRNSEDGGGEDDRRQKSQSFSYGRGEVARW
jgi:hypothetical protein